MTKLQRNAFQIRSWFFPLRRIPSIQPSFSSFFVLSGGALEFVLGDADTLAFAEGKELFALCEDERFTMTEYESKR